MNAVLFTALLLGQPQAPPPPQAPPVEADSPAENYTAQTVAAIKANRPLVTFFGVQPRPIKGAVVAYVDRHDVLEGYTSPAIIVAIPEGGELLWKDTLGANATDAQLATIVSGRRAVSQAGAAPFVEPDAEFPAEVSALLSGMERYATARLTQVSGNRSGGGSNSAVGRLSVPRRWSVPGGLDGLAGWENRLYRLPRNPVRNWLGHVDANDRWADGRVIGNWGGLSEVTYQREYGAGARFADVLMTSRGVFEVRLAERVDGEWRRSVPYRDKAAEPAGYVRVSLQQCAACHDGGMSNPDAPGSGQYGAARIPGGGGVYSEPLAGVE